MQCGHCHCNMYSNVVLASDAVASMLYQMRRTYKSFFTHLHSATTHRYLHKKLVHCAEEVVQCSHLRQKRLFVRRNVPHLRRITVIGMAEPKGPGGCRVGSKLYIPSTLNIALIQWHTQLNVRGYKALMGTFWTL